jgi:hypothetical protein
MDNSDSDKIGASAGRAEDDDQTLGLVFRDLADCRAQFVQAGREWNLSKLMPYELSWLAVVLADPLVWCMPLRFTLCHECRSC